MATLYFSKRLPSEDASFDAYQKFSTWVTGGYRADIVHKRRCHDGPPQEGDLVVDGPADEIIVGFHPCHSESYWTVLDLIQAWFELGGGAQYLFSFSMHLGFIAVACAAWDNDGHDPDDSRSDLNIVRDWDSRDVTLHQLHNVELRQAMLPQSNADGYGLTRHPVFDERWFLEWKMKSPQVKGRSW